MKTAKELVEKVLFPNYKIKLGSVYDGCLKYGYIYVNGTECTVRL